jgi:hypothetical protein
MARGFLLGAVALATLRSAAMNLLRMAGFNSIREGLQAVMHDITTLLDMVRRQPAPSP